MFATSITCTAALLVPLVAAAETSQFEARVQAVDLLDSDEVADKITACAEGEEAAPEHVDVEVTVDDQGALAGVALLPELGARFASCVRDALAGLAFPTVTGGFTASHRIKLGHAAAATAAPEEPAAEPGSGEFADPDPSRVVYGQTAIPRQQGVFNATVHDLGYWVLEYGVHENVAVGLKLILPIGFVAFTPNIRTGFQVGDNVWLGGSVNYTFLTPYIEDGGDFYFMSYGGTLSLSAGSDKFLFNFALTGQGVTVMQEDDPTANEGFFLPQLGFSVRLHEMVKLNAEISTPLVTDDQFMSEQAGRVWIIMYGIRIHGDNLYGDISFVWPAFEDAWEFMRYVPMGFPMLSFGFKIGGGDDDD